MATQAAHERPLVSGDRKTNPVGGEPVRRGGAPLGGHGGEPRIKAPVDGFDVHLQAVSTRRAMAALLADKRLFSSMFGGLVHTQLRTSEESFWTLGTLEMYNISANVHVENLLKVGMAPVRSSKGLTACGLG